MKVCSFIRAAALSALLFTGGRGAGAAVEPAGSADDFVDRIGFCTHWGYTDTPYGLAYDKVKQALGDAGIRNVRDGLHERETDLYQTYGIRTCLVVGPQTNLNTLPDYLKKHKDIISMIEGPNEVDIFPSSANYKGQGYPQGPKLFMADLYKAVKSDPDTRDMEVIAPSVGRADGTRAMAPLKDFDLLVMHSYAGGAMPSKSLAADMNSPILTAYELLGRGADLKPFAVTESGYHTALGSTVVLAGNQPGVSEKVQGKYLPRHFALYYNFGIRRTFTYEFVDEFPDYTADEREATNAEACFGIFKRDMTPKPAYGAIKNLIALLCEKKWNRAAQRWEMPAKSPADYRPAALDFTFSGDTQNLRHTLLQKSNGDFYLLLWQEVSSFDRAKRQDITNPDATVTVTLAPKFKSAALYTLKDAATPAQTFTAGQKLTLSIPDEVVVLKITPARSVLSAAGSAVGVRNTRAESGATTANLTWESAPGFSAAGYCVRRMGAFVGSTEKPTWSDAGLMPGAGYQYEVAAYDSRGRLSTPVMLTARTKNLFPDLVVSEVVTVPAHPSPGDSVTFTATIQNIGTAATPSSVTHGVAFFLDKVFVAWADTFNGPLAPGASFKLTANNGPKGSATIIWPAGDSHTLLAHVDDVNRIIESDKTNNEKTVNVSK